MTARTLSLACLSLLATLFSATGQAAIKDCDSLKQEIDAKLQAKGVSGYELKIEATDAALAPGVIEVGSCNGGQHKITYFRG